MTDEIIHRIQHNGKTYVSIETVAQNVGVAENAIRNRILHSRKQDNEAQWIDAIKVGGKGTWFIEEKAARRIKKGRPYKPPKSKV